MNLKAPERLPSKMKKLTYSPKQKQKSSSLMALGFSERDAAESLIKNELYRESVVHLYFACFYISQALLCKSLNSDPSHHSVETQLHKSYGRDPNFPRRYIQLHSTLHTQRNEFNYKTNHAPNPKLLKLQLKTLIHYVEFAKKLAPKVEVIDILNSLADENPNQIRDFSFDIYCPKTYSHHTRLTFWQPPFYKEIYGVNQIISGCKVLLKKLKVRQSENYVIGLNSKVNQYQDDHLIMIDIDTINPAVESALKPIRGILLKSGRGFHFIGRKVITGINNWRREMKSLMKNKTLKGHIDRNHIIISLRRGYSTLRVTSSPSKPTVPYFYKEL